MDFNDLEQRLKRLYHAVDQQYEDDVKNNIRQETVALGNGLHEHRISFGNSDESELQNKVMNVVHAVAGLKDHITNKLSKEGQRSSEYENYIDSIPELSIITDLDNKDKHGDPLIKTNRSGIDPKIVNIQQALSGKGATSFSMSFSFDGNRSEVEEMSGNLKIVITGEVVDSKGTSIMSLSDLLDKGVESVEAFLKSHNLDQ